MNKPIKKKNGLIPQSEYKTQLLVWNLYGPDSSNNIIQELINGDDITKSEYDIIKHELISCQFNTSSEVDCYIRGINDAFDLIQTEDNFQIFRGNGLQERIVG